MRLTIEAARGSDGTWLAEVARIPGALADGATREEAIARAKALSLRVLADYLENGEPLPEDADFLAVAPA